MIKHRTFIPCSTDSNRRANVSQKRNRRKANDPTARKPIPYANDMLTREQQDTYHESYAKSIKNTVCKMAYVAQKHSIRQQPNTTEIYNSKRTNLKSICISYIQDSNSLTRIRKKSSRRSWKLLKPRQKAALVAKDSSLLGSNKVKEQREMLRQRN